MDFHSENRISPLELRLDAITWFFGAITKILHYHFSAITTIIHLLIGGFPRGLFTHKNGITLGELPMPEGLSTIIHLCPRSTSYRARGNSVDYMGNCIFLGYYLLGKPPNNRWITRLIPTFDGWIFWVIHVKSSF